MNSIPCDIVILPEDELKNKAIELSKILKSDETLYTLDGANFHPHTSLYMAQLKTEDIESVVQILAKIAYEYQIQQLQATNYYQVMGFVDIEYRKTQTLDDLASAVVKAINPIRDGMREKDALRMKSANGLALQNFQTYGYKYVGGLFRPHISITRYNTEKTIDTTTLPPIKNYNGEFSRIGLFEMGDNGTCIREIASFNLE